MASENAYALIHAKSDFDIVPPYYKLFPQEVSSIKDNTGSQTDLNITLPTTRGRVANFEELIDAMTTHAVAADKNFVVVSHGLHDAKNVPIALGLDLTSATQQKANDFFFETMANWQKKGMSASTAADEEAKVFFSVNGKKVKLAAGVLSGLHAKLVALRALKLHRVELRACALGANLPFLRNIRIALGADLMTAPDQHMFFTEPMNLMKIHKEKGKTTTSNEAMTDEEFKQFTKRHPHARIFQDNSSSDRFGCENNGTGPKRTIFAATTAQSLSWFVEQNIMSGSNYPRAVKAVSFQPTPFANEIKGAPYVMRLPPPPMPFSIAAIDLPQGNGNTTPYALPLESDYVNHLALVP